MKICFRCKKEMRCKKNGMVAVWKKNHAYAGDLFECPNCKSNILVTNVSPHQVTDIGIARLRKEGCLLEMG